MVSNKVCFSQPTALLMSLLLLGFLGATVRMCKCVFEQSLKEIKDTATTVATTTQQAPTAPITVPLQNLIPPPPNQAQVPTISPSQVSIVPVGGLNQGPYTSNTSVYNTEFRHLGYLQSNDISSEGQKLTLPLYGRRKYPRSERYEYYVINKSNIQIPFTQKSDKEIWDEDTVTVPGFDGTFRAEIYPVKELTYNPYGGPFA